MDTQRNTLESGRRPDAASLSNAASAPATTLPRVVSLTVNERGQSALDIARAWGWHAEHTFGDFELSGDVLKSDSFALSRYQHTAASFRYSVPTAFDNGAARLMLACLEGQVDVDIDGVTERLTPGRVIFANPEDLAGKRAAGPVSNLMVIFPRPQPVTDNYVSESRAADGYLKVLAQASAAILESGLRAEDPAFTRVALGVEALVWALATQSPLRILGRARTPLERIYNEAVKHIALHAGDSAVTVDSIARTLGVSRTQFYRAFIETGETPSSYLRRARVHLAERLLQDDVSVEIAAQTSGFGTVRRMRTALSSARALESQQRRHNDGGSGSRRL